MRNKLNRLRFFLSLLGTANWYRGLDKPNFLQWLYGWRIGVKTAWKVSGIVWNK